MPGFNRHRVVGVSEQDLDEFTCNLCQNIFVNPMITQCCGQTYCKECINNWLGINSVCPNDRQPMRQHNLVQSPKFIINILNNMRVKCVYYLEGCLVVLPMNEVGKHVYNCDFKPKLLCKTCGYEENDYGLEHNCIRNLLNKNSAKNEENNRLEERVKRQEQQIASLIVENQGILLNNMLDGQLKALEIAKNYLDACTIIYKTDSITVENCTQMIDKCKEAILLRDGFTSIAEHIVERLENDKRFRKIKWTAIVNVFQTVGIKASHHYCLCMRFGSLGISILGFKLN